MYTKEQIRNTFVAVFRGAGELWFPYAGRDEDIMVPVDEHWQKLVAVLEQQPQQVVGTLDVKQIVQLWLDKQGHDACHYYPEIFNAIATKLGATRTTPLRLPVLAEFQRGCERFQAEQYGANAMSKPRAPDEEDHDAFRVAEFKRDMLAPTPPRVLVIGVRRFHRDAAATTDCANWTWENMLRCPGMTPTRTALAWQRLEDVGLQIADAVDLLPPGGEVDDTQAIQQARYIQGVLAGLEAADQGYDVVVLLGGKVSKAFRSADSRLADLRLLELRHGFITMPTPHVVEQDADGWWSNDVKQARLKSIVGKIMSWHCVDCVNGDGDVQGCVTCGTHSAGCSRGEFCVQCRRAS